MLATEGGSVSQAGRSGFFRDPVLSTRLTRLLKQPTPVLPVLHVSCSYPVRASRLWTLVMNGSLREFASLSIGHRHS
jgi:hypothetical protein